jgi:hypothetical protein
MIFLNAFSNFFPLSSAPDCLAASMKRARWSGSARLLFAAINRPVASHVTQ